MDENKVTQKGLLFEILTELRKLKEQKPKNKVEKIQSWIPVIVAIATIAILIYTVYQFDFTVNSYKDQLTRAETARLLGQKIDVNSAILEFKHNLDTMEDYITDEKYLKYHYRMGARFETKNITEAITSGSIDDVNLIKTLWNVKNFFETFNRALDDTKELYNNASTKEQKEAEVETGNMVNIENMKKVYPYFSSILDDLMGYEQSLKEK